MEKEGQDRKRKKGHNFYFSISLCNFDFPHRAFLLYSFWTYDDRRVDFKGFSWTRIISKTTSPNPLASHKGH